MLKELMHLANHLDQKGLIKEADFLDGIIIKLSSEEELTLVQKLFILDEKLSLFARNYNHNLAFLFNLEKQILGTGKQGKIDRFYSKFDYDDFKEEWLESEKAKKSLAEMMEVDPELTRETIREIHALGKRYGERG